MCYVINRERLIEGCDFSAMNLDRPFRREDLDMQGQPGAEYGDEKIKQRLNDRHYGSGP